MDTVITILTNIIDEQGVEYLQRSPYAVYQKLISEKARSDYARLVLITLLCNASVKAGEMDEAELSKDLQNSCFLRKKAAEDFHDYVTGDDYYPPVSEDFEAEEYAENPHIGFADLMGFEVVRKNEEGN